MTHKRANARVLPSNALHTREALPGINRTKDGTVLTCPFCTPSHPIVPNEPNACGTVLRVTAVQTIIPARVTRMQKLTCLKCHQAGGEMVQYMNGYIHLTDCTPGTKLLRVPPRYNRMAAVVSKLPAWARGGVEKYTGRAEAIREINLQGEETGKVLGYIFMKGQPNAARTTPEPTT